VDHEPSTDSEATYRLPRSVTPSRYDLTLEPSLDTATFDGHEAIAVTVHEPVTEIVLNAAELVIHHAELVDDEGTKLAGTVTLDEEQERATIALDGTAGPGHWTLELTFHGILNDKLRGFYRSTFTDEAGTQHVIGTTQFEAPHARRRRKDRTGTRWRGRGRPMSGRRCAG